ncbi:SH3 domain-containing protein [Xanthobacter sp. TB0136]|uniref:SH3 domain-containing protein n=1 Tax=Xanthobacter sp. TB0136 TaxID=3459177 RepID=UPI00403A22B3
MRGGNARTLGWLLLLAIVAGWMMSGGEEALPESGARQPASPVSSQAVTLPASLLYPAAMEETVPDTEESLSHIRADWAEAAQPAATPEPRILHVRVRANIRARPSTTAPIIARAAPGTELRAHRRSGNWWLVQMDRSEGWVREDLLSSTPVPAAIGTAAPLMATRSTPVAARTDRPHISRQETQGRQGTQGKSGPVRAAYKGRCECPYDIMRNGHRCGGRSAYSRPGGHKPKCYY